MILSTDKIQIQRDPTGKTLNVDAAKRAAIPMKELYELAIARLQKMKRPESFIERFVVADGVMNEILAERYCAECAIDTKPIELEIAALKNVRTKTE